MLGNCLAAGYNELYLHSGAVLFFVLNSINNNLFSILTAEVHSERRLFIGFANAALIAWKLIVASAIIIAINPPAANNHQLI